MTDAIVIRVLRPLLHRGEHVPAGATLRVAPLEAAGLLDSGKVELAHAGDREACRQAVRADVAAALRRVAAPPPALPVDPRWH